jgi:anionic cell wall polymer biosynthesis LytR-Cps2A-Psr (LCP) family protein
MSANPSPAIAAILSFIFPGAGQIYAGETRKGILWAIPMLVFVAAVIWLLLGGQNALLGLISSSSKRMALLALNLAFFLYHLAAMFDAYGVAKRERSRFSFGGSAPILLAILASLTIVIHGVPEAAAVSGFEQLCKIVRCEGGDSGVIPPASFSPLPTPGPQTPTPIPSPSPSPTVSPRPTGSSGSPGPTGTPGPSGTPTPVPTRSPLPPLADFPGSWPLWADDGLLNILIAGTDSRSDTGVDDNSLRTDTMLLLTVDIQAGKAAMFSFPRNMCTPSIDGSCGAVGIESRYPDWLRIPLPSESAGVYPNGVFPEMLNALWRRAAEHPEFNEYSPGIGQECAQQYTCTRAWRALVGTIQEMAGVRIDGIVSVNLSGFVALVDNLPPTCPPRAVRVALTNADCFGGVWLDVPEPLHDDIYHTSNGELMTIDIEAGCQFFDGEMALAYSRSRHESSDYDRARRQQYVLTQVRKQLDPLALLPHIPQLLQVAQQNIFLSWSDTDIQFLAQAASRIDADRIYKYDFAPNKVAALGSMQGIRDKVNNIFSEPEPEPEVRPNQPPCPPRN